MCEEKKSIETQLFEMMRLQCRLMDQIRMALTKIEKRIKGDQHPMVSKDAEVMALYGQKKPEKTLPPLDDRI